MTRPRRASSHFPKGKLIDEIVINQDLAPTYLDLAGLPAHLEMQGASFKELARQMEAVNFTPDSFC